MGQTRNGETRAVEEAFVRPEMDAGPGIAFATGTSDVQIFYFFTVFKGDAVDLTVATNRYLYAF